MTETRSIRTIIQDCAERALSDQQPDGSMPAGHNGPWNDPETPVRNTGHWAITFLRCYEWSGDDRFRTAGEHAIDFLLSDEARPHGATFHHRIAGDKDQCNGLIGQAWSIEPLVVAAELLDRPELVELASDVFLLHPYESSLAAWHPVEIDGTVNPIDMTFNHQLWFAAAGGLLAQHPASDPAVDEQVRRYLDELSANLNVMDGGLVYHPFKPAFDLRKYSTIFAEGLKAGTAHTMVLGVLKGLLGSDGNTEDAVEGGWTEKSVGYHSFNLYAFGLLKEAYPEHSVWEDPKLAETVSYAASGRYVEALDGNPYGYPYNCAGIETVYALDVFTNLTAAERQRWLDRQFERTYDSEDRGMTRNNPDPTTLTARLYEATRLPETNVTVGSEDQ